jgi:hypothetical protein
MKTMKICAAARKKRVLFKCDPERVSNALDMVQQRFLGRTPGPDMSQSDWSREVLSDRQIVYAVDDVAYLFATMAAILAAADKNDRRIIELDLGVLRVCLSIYKHGLPINRDLLERQLETRREALARARNQANVYFPDIDFGSSPSSIRALGKAGIYVESIEKRTLLAHAENLAVRAMIKVRNLLAEMRDLETKFRDHLRVDGRIHGRIFPEGTGTGRCSSKQPNLQNIKREPLEDELSIDPELTNFRALAQSPAEWLLIKSDWKSTASRMAPICTRAPRDGSTPTSTRLTKPREEKLGAGLSCQISGSVTECRLKVSVPTPPLITA